MEADERLEQLRREGDRRREEHAREQREIRVRGRSWRRTHPHLVTACEPTSPKCLFAHELAPIVLCTGGKGG